MAASMPRGASSDPRPSSRLVSADERLRSIDELDAAIVSLARHLNAEIYRLLVLVREFDDRLGWAKWSFPSCAEWLAWRCGLSLSAAREKVRTAHALRGLPAISRAFAKGRLSYTKVRALTRVVNAENEDLLLAYALNANAPQVEERCRQMRNVAPDSTDLANRAWERRSLTVLRQADTGSMRITLEVPIEDGELVAKAIDRAVETEAVARGPELDSAGWQAQQADAFVALARCYLNGGARHGSAGTADHYQVVVHVDESALRRAHQNGAESLHGGISHPNGAARSDLPLETIMRLTCDGSVVKLLEDANGNPLAVGRKQRTVPLAIKRALYARDRGCTFPGCHRKRYVDAHHIEHWAQGGETSDKNLTLLCTQHHRLLHEGRFSIGRDIDRGIYFARHDGRVIPRCGHRQRDCTDDDVGEVREPRGLYLAPNPRASRLSHTMSAQRLRDRMPS